jgi:hypothetical protein
MTTTKTKRSDVVAIAAALALIGVQGCDLQNDVPREGVDAAANPGDGTPGDDHHDDDDDDHDDDDHDDDHHGDGSGGHSGGGDDGDDDQDDCGDDDDDDDDDELVMLDPAICSPANGAFSLDITNPYSPMPVGKTLILEGMEEGALVRVEIRVLDETMTVMGIATRVVTETEFVDGELVELSRNFYAQAADGTVCYFGEEVTDYENGMPVPADDGWLAGIDNARPGIFMPGNPQVGTAFATEIAPGVAEDMRAILEVGVPVSVPAGDFPDALHAIDWNPLEGETSADGEDKWFASGIGLVIDDVVELISCDDSTVHPQ